MEGMNFDTNGKMLVWCRKCRGYNTGEAGEEIVEQLPVVCSREMVEPASKTGRSTSLRRKELENCRKQDARHEREFKDEGGIS